MNEILDYRISVDKFVFKIRKDYYYSRDDFWVKIENSTAKIGASDYLQRTNGDVAFVKPLTKGTKIKQFEEFGQIETVKAVIPVISPVSGQIIRFNNRLEKNPEAVNEDPYDTGWIVSVKLERTHDDLKHLLSAEKYLETVKKKIEDTDSLQRNGL